MIRLLDRLETQAGEITMLKAALVKAKADSDKYSKYWQEDSDKLTKAEEEWELERAALLRQVQDLQDKWDGAVNQLTNG